MKLGILKGHRRNMSKISKKHRHDPSQQATRDGQDPDQDANPPTNYNDEAPLPVPKTEPLRVPGLGLEEDSSLSLGSDSGSAKGSDCGSCDGSESEFTSLKMDQATCAASATTTPKPAGAPTAQAQAKCTVLSGLSAAKKQQFAAFQPWVLRTYGDSAKTKTITLKKCARIIKTLNGEESSHSGGGGSSVENSKFRFWVKTKGFQTKYRRPRMNNNLVRANAVDELATREDNKVQEYLQLKPDLFVPSLVKDERAGSGPPVEKQVYKRVAIVEQFFDIIYTVHTKIEARSGKHAGQKRTYRAITEKYAFLPREAVTRFLLQCADCQKRMSLGSGHGNSKAKALSLASSPDNLSARKDSPPGPGRGLLREPNAAARPVPTPTRRLRECRLKPALIKKAVNTIVRKSKQQQQHRILPISIAALKRQHAHAHACTQQKKIPNGGAAAPTETEASGAGGGAHEQQHRDSLRLKPKPKFKSLQSPDKAELPTEARPAVEMDMKYCLPFTTTYLRQQRQNQDQGTQTLKTEQKPQQQQQPQPGDQDRQDDRKCEGESKNVLHEHKYTHAEVQFKHQRQEEATATEKKAETQTPTKDEKPAAASMAVVDRGGQYEDNHSKEDAEDDASSSSSGEESISVSSSVRAQANSSSSDDDEEDEFEDEEEHEKILLGSHNILGRGHSKRRQQSRSPKPFSAESRMVKMSGASGRKRLAPTKVTTGGGGGGKVKSSKAGSGGGSGGGGMDPAMDPFPLSLKESGHFSGGSGSGSGSCGSGSSADENHEDLVLAHGKAHSHSKHGSVSKIMKMEHSSSPVDWLGYHPMGLGKPGTGGMPGATSTPITNNNSIFVNGKHGHEARKQSSPISLTERSGPGGGHHERDENSSNGNKDDEDDDDEDSLDKADAHQYDPERLKAFNMFVRLFVDENLDRMVPISKQPKEKIQAIIDSCTRQFPEYAERARKRIRTYLKSCRRNKRIKDGGGGVGVGWESTRPTPAHLTSAQAEQILAQACENESQNAKRMRMGLEPISQPIPSSNGNGNVGGGNNARLANENGCFVSRSSNSTPSPEKILKLSNNSILHSSASPSTTAMPSPSSTAATISAVVAAAVAASANSTCSSLSSPSSGISSLSAFSDTGCSATSAGNANGAPHINLLSSGSSSGASGHHQHNHLVNGSSSPTSPFVDSPLMNSTSMSGLSKLVGAERGNHVVDYSRRLNGSTAAAAGSVSMYKPNFCQSLSKPGQFPGSLFSPTNAALNGLNGDAGPTDLSMKAKSSTAAAATALLTQHLNLTELATVRQLIIGYRESAAFLLRSADELEQLLMQQQ